jgi:hypothetical protein
LEIVKIPVLALALLNVPAILLITNAKVALSLAAECVMIPALKPVNVAAALFVMFLFY